MCIYIYIYTVYNIYIYIYIHRERELKNHAFLFVEINNPMAPWWINHGTNETCPKIPFNCCL